MADTASEQHASAATPHNLRLYRLEGFSGRRTHLLTLHEWLTGSNSLPTIAISGDQGNGKSTVATAAAWNHFHHFTDGIIWVGAAGTAPFRLYDVVRTLDVLFGTKLTRVSEDRWGISILEQLYRRKRLLIIDKLAGATEQELDTLVDIIGHLRDAGGYSRVLLIDRNLSPSIAALVQHQHLPLNALRPEGAAALIRQRAPQGLLSSPEDHFDELYSLTGGRPLLLRIVLGLMLDYSWEELSTFLQEQGSADTVEQTHNIVAFAVENYAMLQPQVGPLLNRLVSAAGGASLEALRHLFWRNLGTDEELDQVLHGLVDRALIDRNIYRQRVVLHPVVRGYLAQNVVMLGEDWDRSHATYYATLVERYQSLPQDRWPEIDADWGNIYMASDWCADRVNRLWQADPMAVLADPSIDTEVIAWPADADEYLDDLRLARAYALGLAYYAFWRHPLGIIRWLAAGALASLSLKDVRDYAWLQTNMGRQLFFHGEVETAIHWLERGRDAFDRQDLMSELAYVYTDLGTSFRILDRPRKALDYFVAAFESVAQTGEQWGLTTAFMNLGSAYYSLEDYERAIEQQRKALRIALRLQDDHGVASAYNNMGLAMEGLDRPDEAARAYEYALDVFQRIDDATGISACYNNLGSACYARSDFGQALTWYELDLNLSERRGNWTDMAATLHNLGHVALEQNSIEPALAYFRQSRDLYAAFELTEYVREEEAMIEYIESQLIT